MLAQTARGIVNLVFGGVHDLVSENVARNRRPGRSEGAVDDGVAYDKLTKSKIMNKLLTQKIIILENDWIWKR